MNNLYNGIDKRFEDLTNEEFIDALGMVSCKDCEKRTSGNCERLKEVELARPWSRPWFACEESERGYICKEFEVPEWYPLLKNIGEVRIYMSETIAIWFQFVKLESRELDTL